MKYKSKINERIINKITPKLKIPQVKKKISLINKLTGNVADPNRIIRNNKIETNSTSVSNSASKRIGRIVNKSDKENIYDKNERKKNMENNLATEVKEKNGQIKTIQKGAITYVKYNGNEIPIAHFIRTADDKLMKNLKRQKRESNFSGSFSQFLIKNYS